VTTTRFILKKAKHAVIPVLPIAAITKHQAGEEITEIGKLRKASVAALSDDGKPVANSQLMRIALEQSRAFDLPVIDHCEDPNLFRGGAMNEGARSRRLRIRGIPAAAEEIMVYRNIALARLTGARVHLAHMSTAGSMELI